MSDSDRHDEETGGGGPQPTEPKPGETPGTPEPPHLRRGLFGYRRDDVDRALGERDSQVAELRQDIAALWLAFAQHDRMIREALAGGEAGAPAAGGQGTEGAAGVGGQLADLDDVLAAIETATRTLERSYGAEPAPEGGEAAEEPGAGEDRPGEHPPAP